MSKRNMVVVVVCIVVATASFLGGVAYKYEDVVPVVEYDYGGSKFTYDFVMPLTPETAYVWLDWALVYHQYLIDNEVFEDMGRLDHEAYMLMYMRMKDIVLQFENDPRREIPWLREEVEGE